MRNPQRSVDYLIIGAGPAGLQLAYFLRRAGRDCVVLEAEEVGAFFRRYPRHRRLISFNKVHTGCTDPDKNLRWDWNSLLSEPGDTTFRDVTADYLPRAESLVDYLADFAVRHELPVVTGARVTRIGRAADGGFDVSSAAGDWHAGRVVVATGHTVPHTPPGVPGIEHCEQYAEIPTDPAAYTDQRVLIVGKGNSGLETAENIFQHTAAVHVLSPHPVRLAWTTHHVSDLRACYNNTLDSYQLKMQNTVLDGRLERIDRRGDGRLQVRFAYSHAGGQEWELTVDRVLLCCGFRFDWRIFDSSLRPDRCHDGRWPAMTSSWESTTEPGLYFAGTLMQARDYKKSFSGFIHGFRYDIRFLAEVLAERYHGVEPELGSLPRTAEALTGRVIARATDASSLFQLPAFLADVYLLDGPEVAVRSDVPVDYAAEDPGLRDRDRLVMTLEYGQLPRGADPFDFPRDPADGTTSQFIHPVLRLIRRGELVREHHVPEDLENEWDKPMYVEPCRAAVAEMLEAARPAVLR